MLQSNFNRKLILVLTFAPKNPRRLVDRALFDQFAKQAAVSPLVKSLQLVYLCVYHTNM